MTHQPIEKLIVKRTDKGYELYADETLLFETDSVETMEAVLDAIYEGDEPTEYLRRPQ